MEELTGIQTALKAWFWKEAFTWTNWNSFKQQHEQAAGCPCTTALQAATNMLSSMPQPSLAQGGQCQQCLGAAGAGTAAPVPNRSWELLGAAPPSPRNAGSPCRLSPAPRSVRPSHHTAAATWAPGGWGTLRNGCLGHASHVRAVTSTPHGFSWDVPRSPPCPCSLQDSPHSIPTDMLGKPGSVFTALGKPGHCSLCYFCFFHLELCSSEAITLWARFCFPNFQRTVSKHSR